jgi:glutamine cyclotransferase
MNNRIVTFFAAAVLAAMLPGCRGCGAGARDAQPPQEPVPQTPRGPVQYGYEVVGSYPHDTDSYTQGLYWHEGYMWEGTGEYGNSKLRKVELATGNVLREVSLAPVYFGEGIALHDGKIYQLTWREGEAFVYDAGTFEKIGGFEYPGEGWGLTTDGEKLYMSDGSNKIKVLDPADFRVVSTFDVTDGGRPVGMLNELEWIDGKIWANVYLTDEIVVIDPADGKLTARIDLSGLLPRMERTPHTDVLNGIAWDAADGRIFVTGKRWPRIYEIKLKDEN